MLDKEYFTPLSVVLNIISDNEEEFIKRFCCHEDCMIIRISFSDENMYFAYVDMESSKSIGECKPLDDFLTWYNDICPKDEVTES